MDIVTQGLLGGVLAQSLAKQADKKRATLVGIFSGLLADVDFFIRSTDDPLLNLEFHRHFTHSLVFIPLGALIAFVLLWPFLKNKLTPASLYLFCLLGYSMSGVLDAMTSYGTHLFWPFTDEKVALNIISIIDPVFSLILLVTLVTGLLKPHMRVAMAGIVIAALYIGIGVIQHWRVYEYVNSRITNENIQSDKLIVKPTIGNQILWRCIYITEGQIKTCAVRTVYFSTPKLYEGKSVPLVTLENNFADLDPDSVLYNDIKRFIAFSDGFVAFDPVRSNVLGDLRYSMLPNSNKPLWGIVIDPANPQQHVEYRFFRDNTADVRQQYLDMLFGNIPAQ